MANSAPVEAEDELIEVALGVLGREAVIDAERLGFEVEGGGARPRKDNVGGHCSDRMRIVDDFFGAGVVEPPICLGGSTWRKVLFEKCAQAAGGGLGI